MNSPSWLSGTRRYVIAFAHLVLVGCGDRKAPAPQELTQLKVGIVPISEVAPIYVGMELGFFEQEGLRIQLSRLAGGADILPAVATGELDVGFTNVVSLLFFAQNRSAASFRIITGGSYETSNDQNHALIALDSISSLDQSLRDRTFAVNTRNNIEELMLRRFLESKGIADGQYRLRAIPFPAMNAALENRDVDLASVVEPFIARASRTGKKLFARQYLTSAQDTVIVATYVTSQKWIAANTETAARFRRAFAKATAFIADSANVTRVRQIVATATSVPETDAFAMGLPLIRDCFSVGKAREIDTLMKKYFAENYQGVNVDSLVSADAARCRE